MSLRKLIIAAVGVLLVLGLSTVASAKSLYVIANHDGTYSAYNINPDGTVTWQADYSSGAWGPAGMAVHSDSATLFVTYEFSGNVVLVDAVTMAGLGSVPAPGADDLAGIDVDDVNDIVYAMDRWTDDLYAYDWDGVALTLKAGYPLELTTCGGSFGIALDEIAGVLYVACTSAGGTVRGYDTTTWNEVIQFTPAMSPVGIAVDRIRGFVYTTAPNGYCASAPSGNTLLSKYDLATSTETTVDMGRGGMGIAVDEVTGYAYVTCGCDGDDLAVWDAVTTDAFIPMQTTGPIGSPAGLTMGNVSFNPLNLTKSDGQVDDDCVVPGRNFTYELCYDNLGNPFDITGALLTDNLPAEVHFVSGGIYDSDTHAVEWALGPLPAGSGQACLLLELELDLFVEPDSTFINFATIDSDQTPPTTVEEETKVCPMIPMAFDIKPTSCRNPLQMKGGGVLPTAVVGTADFDVTQLDPASMTLEGVSPLRWAYEDVATPYYPMLGKEDAFDCHALGADGYLDLTLKFDKAAIVAALGEVNDGDVMACELYGNLKLEFGGIPIIAEDVVVMVE